MRRRDFLRSAAVGAVAVTTGAAPEPGDSEVFGHGVASGDPLADRVLLWTRVDGADGDVDVRWRVARDPELRQVVASGRATASPERDHTVHVDATGLEPATTWYYAFDALGGRSPVGRTRTAPAPGAPTPGDRLRIGVVSCAAMAEGWFTAYARLAERDLDLVVHLGDYIYEHDEPPVAPDRRHDPPHELVTLDDYRRRHRQYRTDPDLRRLHQLHPVAAVWDDHDVAENAWVGGASEHDPERHGPWADRRDAAVRAWLEWLPVRRPDGAARVHRALPLGDLADLLLLDTRLEGRDRQVGDETPDVAAAVADPSRHLVSPAQLTWLADELTASRARWRLLANQVMLAPVRIEVPDVLTGLAGRFALVAGDEVLNPDQWDGYEAERDRLLAVLRDGGVRDVVVLTGDLHSSWAAEVPDPAGDAPLAVEFVAPSVTSTAFAEIVGTTGPMAEFTRQTVLLPNTHLRWADLERHGYVVLDVGADAVQADWWHVDDVTEPGADEHLAASWRVRAGEARLHEAERGAPERGAAAVLPADVPPPAAREDASGPWGWGLVVTAAGAATGALVWLRRRTTGG